MPIDSVVYRTANRIFKDGGDLLRWFEARDCGSEWVRLRT
jgi:hypothetical protein